MRHVPLQQGSISRAARTSRSRWTTSKQAIPARTRRSEAIDRALKTVRSRIEGFGVSEAIVSEAGRRPHRRSDSRRFRILNARGKLVEAQAFLEFKITDKSQALERDVAASIDQVIKQRGLAAKVDTAA